MVKTCKALWNLNPQYGLQYTLATNTTKPLTLPHAALAMGRVNKIQENGARFPNHS
jgi:hypothetical protein